MENKKKTPCYNKAQKQAIEHFKGPMMVLAGPGSGKTMVITHRIRHLIETHKIAANRILVITFTKAAAQEMRGRFQKLMGGSQFPVRFGTFHAIFFSILKQAYHYDVSNIIHDRVKKRILGEIIEPFDFDVEDTNDLIEQIESEISLVKGERISLEHYYPISCPKEVFQKIFVAYETQLRQKRLIDFDDMLVQCYELLLERPDVRKMWQREFEYILIDEFQDINKLQYDIIALLAEPENNLFIVGDDDQSIYRFRGAKPEIMLQFEKKYPNAKRVLLDVNYRSTVCIVETAGMVIRRNKVRFPKNIKSNNERGEEVQIREFENINHENQQIVEKIKEFQKQGVSLSEIAVLVRTNTQPRALLQCLVAHNIPFTMKDQIPNLYDHWVVKNVLVYIQIAMGKRDRGLFLQISNKPNRYLSRQAFSSKMVSFSQLREFYKDKNWMLERLDTLEYDLQMIKKMTPYAGINYIRKAVGYDGYLAEYGQERNINVDELYEKLDELQELAKPYQSYEHWFAQIAAYEKELEEQGKKKQETVSDGVVIATMHGSKGLEYEIVFVTDCNEGVVPHQKAMLEEDIEEERRMFYVAMTRAKKQLFLYFVKERFNKELTMSRFLAELLDEQ